MAISKSLNTKTLKILMFLGQYGQCSIMFNVLQLETIQMCLMYVWVIIYVNTYVEKFKNSISKHLFDYLYNDRPIILFK